MPPRQRIAVVGSALLAGWGATPAASYTITINPGPRGIYLQIGNGTYIGGNYNAGGQPGNNATINTVSLTLTAASVGNGTVQQMTTNSTASNSFIDGFAFCNTPAQMYVGGWTRAPSGGGVATLSVTTPPALTSGGDTIPFNQISWTSGGNGGDAGIDVPSGTFVGGTQTLTTYPVNEWREQCLTFRYANATVPAAGTYTGRATSRRSSRGCRPRAITAGRSFSASTPCTS